MGLIFLLKLICTIAYSDLVLVYTLFSLPNPIGYIIYKTVCIYSNRNININKHMSGHDIKNET